MLVFSFFFSMNLSLRPNMEWIQLLKQIQFDLKAECVQEVVNFDRIVAHWLLKEFRRLEVSAQSRCSLNLAFYLSDVNCHILTELLLWRKRAFKESVLPRKYHHQHLGIGFSIGRYHRDYNEFKCSEALMLSFNFFLVGKS